ncbi:hypothetical protein E4U33_005874 [Claviceps sp. LM78 group G4]|nr:hypothetical protein E4U33_005874 [Claviceps sp. LM78 group G4]
MIGVLECPLDLARLVLSFSLRVLRPLCGSKILVSNFTTFIFIRRLDTQRQSRCRYERKSLTDFSLMFLRQFIEPQVFPNQAEDGQGGQAKPPCARLDQTPNQQPHPFVHEYLSLTLLQLQRQEKALEKDPPQHLSNSPLEPHFRIWDCCRKRSTTTMVLAFQR